MWIDTIFLRSNQIDRSIDFQVFNFVRYFKRDQDVEFDGVSESQGLPAMPVRIRTRGPVFPAGRQSRGGSHLPEKIKPVLVFEPVIKN